MSWKDNLAYICGVVSGFITVVVALLFLPFIMLFAIALFLIFLVVIKLVKYYIKTKARRILKNEHKKYN